MQAQKNTTHHLQKLASHLFNFGMVTGLATLTFGLISCGGGGGEGSATASSGSTTPTITSISPVGMVASSVPKTLSILGSNFENGMTLSIANSSGVTTGFNINSSAVTSSTVMTMNVSFASAPSDNYVTVSIRKASGTPATAVLGVAGANKTLADDIQTIFGAKCGTCHTGDAAQNFLALNNYTASSGSNGPIGIPSVGCSPRHRVVPGDPRRASSFLIDKIKAVSGGAACNGNPMPNLPALDPGALTAQQIQDIIDWVAGGAN